MPHYPLVSIVIPCYNAAPYLEETLSSCMAIRYPHFEIIVMDDGSADESKSILVKWAKQYPEKIRVFQQCNQGPSIARNQGIHHANGKYIVPVDGDDRIHPDYIYQAVKELESDPDIKLVYCEAEKFGGKTGHWILKPFSLEQLAQDNMIFVSSLFRKSDWEKTGGFDPRFCFGWEDWEFWINLLKHGGKVVKLPFVGFYYRIRANSRRKSTNKAAKKMTIDLLNQKHPEFFDYFLNGPLRNPRGLSKYINPFCKAAVLLTLLKPIPAKIQATWNSILTNS